MLASFLGKTEKGEKDERDDNEHPAKKLEASDDIGYWLTEEKCLCMLAHPVQGSIPCRTSRTSY